MENKKLWNALKYFLLTLLCIGLVSYIIYHLVLSLDDSVQTVPTTLVTAEETVSQEGYIFRTEQIVYATPGSFSYHIDDGKRAAKGVALLDVYDSDTSAAAQTELKMLDRRITRLKNSNLQQGMQYSDTTIIDNEISDLYYTILQKVRNGEMDFAVQKTADFVSSLNRRRIITGKIGDYNEQIAALEAQRDELVRQTGDVKETVYAKESGYFFSDIDGFENMFTTAKVSWMTPEEYDALIHAEADYSVSQGEDGTVAAGKLVTDFQWYLTAQVSLDQLRYYNEAQTYTVIFPYNSDKRISMRLEKILQSTDNDSIVLLLATRTNPEGFNYLRRQTIQIVREETSGYRVPISAVRMQDGVQGVYVLRGYEVVFKEIETILETDGYFIVKENDGTPESRGKLALNDQIIISGKNLYVGKIVS